MQPGINSRYLYRQYRKSS